jgi:hypothetical protein
MSYRLSGVSPSGLADSYSPKQRTALVLSGTGTAGAYHAGVLRALQEAGVKLDVVAARGIGVIGAIFAAVDGAQWLWDDKGFWRSPDVRHLYRWHAGLRLLVTGIACSLALVAVPLGAVVAGLLVFPADFVLRMAGMSSASGLVSRYLVLAQAAFAPGGLPTWLPRLVVLVLGVCLLVAAGLAYFRSPTRRQRGRFWWRLVPAPVSGAAAADRCWKVLWDLLRGAARLKEPVPLDLGRRYAELLAENLGQPGFRELVIAVHDIDARRDLVFALVSEHRRRSLVRRSTTGEAQARQAELFDLSGVARDHFPDAVAGSLAIPAATDPHQMSFSPDSYWRGETHRLCDRPGTLVRLIEELVLLDVEQIVLVSAAAESPGPHALAQPRLDGLGRIGDYLQASEAAILRDVAAMAAERGPSVFTIRPGHNPLGPFDFSGGFDDRSDRPLSLVELVTRGYEDAYLQFIEPIVGASGERVGEPV